MQKLVKKKCPTCGIIFLPKSPKNIYDRRICFKKAWYHRKKAEELKNKKFPVFLCPSCKRKITLDFDPVKSNRKWEQFVCPNCHILLINVKEFIITTDINLCPKKDTNKQKIIKEN